MSYTPIQCRCRIENNRILSCPLHERAHGLLAACHYVGNLLAVTAEGEKLITLIREVALPYLDGQITAAEKG